MTVLRVCTREMICRPEISSLVLRAARENGYPSPGLCLAEMARDIQSARQGLFVGIDALPCFVTVGFLPSNAFYLAPTIGLAYSDKAPRQLVAAVGAALRGWFAECGFHETWVLNFLHTDRSFMRGLSHFGEPSKIGSVIRFKF